MAIDLEVALAAEPTVREASWTDRDVMLYQLGLGAGVNALDPAELTWVYEKGRLQWLQAREFRRVYCPHRR